MNEEKLSDFLCEILGSGNNRNVCFSGTVEEYDKFVNGTNQLHKEEKLKMQNKYFREILGKLK